MHPDLLSQYLSSMCRAGLDSKNAYCPVDKVSIIATSRPAEHHRMNEHTPEIKGRQTGKSIFEQEPIRALGQIVQR